MQETESTLNQRIAARVKSLRTVQGISLDALAAKSGVSRSMISLIERGESSPTAIVLEKLAAGLGVMLASMFDFAAAEAAAAPSPISRHQDQSEWKDPGSGYVRRNVSPPGLDLPVQIVEVRFPAGKRVLFDTDRTSRVIPEQIWIQEGSMDVTVDGVRHRLRKGDCLAVQLGRSILFHNPGKKAARYVVVIAEIPR